MNDLLLVLAGGATSLVTSAVVTWSQGRFARRAEVRSAVRDSTRQLTGLLIAERDAPESASSSTLAEAEILSVTLMDRRTRESVRDVIRLLRECELPELEELSGVRSARARQILCDHGLEVLGAHLRGDKLPAAPDGVRRLLAVETEALNIHAGAAPTTTAPSPAPAPAPAPEPAPAGDTGTSPASRKVRRRPQSARTSANKESDAGTDPLD
ncbi:hypothetical protein [Actinorugispora endophytica]|uniref:Uncharacterized protein n=1 Tax=Actinorugispora endophytica TaxID=1605990 RepID=A0A4R6V2J6_9ACTN|nr:hypothetical protein [Actinorugispora endophytica]TDQ52900.1 hypothetical protein EV190_10516 [Actinorugispora endophytica]